MSSSIDKLAGEQSRGKNIRREKACSRNGNVLRLYDKSDRGRSVKKTNDILEEEDEEPIEDEHSSKRLKTEAEKDGRPNEVDVTISESDDGDDEVGGL